jgi:ribosomal protein S14
MSTINPEVTGRRVPGRRGHRPRRRDNGETIERPDSESSRNRDQMRRRRQEALTCSIPEAGARYFGLGRNASYEAAARGEIPTVKVGKLMRVPIRLMEKILDEAGKEKAVA